MDADISSMPDPSKIGLAPDISDMPAPETLGLKAPASETQAAEGDPSDPYAGASTGAAEGVASLASGAAAFVPASVDYIARRIGHLGAGALGYGLAAGDPEHTKRVTDWLNKKADEDTESFNDIQNFWTYAPKTEEGKASLEGVAKATEQLTRPTKDVLHDVGVPESITSKIPAPGPGTETALDIAGGAMRAGGAIPALGLPGELTGAVRAGRAARTAGEATATARAAEAVKPKAAPVTAAQLRSQPNPIPAPNAEEAATSPATLAVQKPKITPRAGESPQAAATRQGILPQAPESSAPGAPAQAPRPPLRQGVDAAQGLYDAEIARLAGNAPAEQLAPQPAAQRGSIFANRQAGAVRLFHPPQEDGPQFAAKATDTDRAARQSTLDEANRLGGGVMTHDRRGAVTGDWEETGNEHQTAKIPDAPGQLLRDQIAAEHQTLHNATQAAHDATGTEALNNVDRDTAEQRGGAVRGAIHAIEDHFNRAANGMYATARATMGDRPMASMPRVQQILSDASHDVNPTASALRRAAQTKLQQLWSVGDTRGNVKTAPGTIGAAERFHEFLNEAYHNDSSGLIRKLKNATDLDVAERAGGNDMFQAARNVIQHRETMLEPDGVNELRRPKDRNKIDNDVPLHEVMDHVTNQDSEHFEHFMNVLRAGAHLSPEVAEKAAAAIREIQGHMISKMHTAARGEAGAWNATNFYKAANRFSTNMPHAFKENPGVLENLKTINRAGNILKIDKSYPGAVAQAAKVGLIPSLAQKAIKGTKLLGEVGGVAHGNLLAAGAAHLLGKGAEAGVNKLTARSRLATAQESLIPRGKERGSVQIFNNASGESPASQEAISRSEMEEAHGQHRWQIDPDGNPIPLRGVDAVDARAPAGHLIVQRGIGDNPKGYTILDRGGLPQSAANGQLARSVGLGKLAAAEKQRGSVQVTRGPKGEAPLAGTPEKEPASRLNIGMHVGDPTAGGNDPLANRVLSKQEALDAIRATGAKVGKTSIVQSDTEPTLVADLDRPLTKAETNALAGKLGQGAIAQRFAGGEGSLHGPQAADWGGKYNPDFFRMHSGNTATEEHPVLGNLSEPERAQLRANTTQRLIDQFHALPETPEFAAAALAGKAKRGWYRASAESIANTFGPDAPRFSAVLAAMSPQQSVQANFHNALRTFVNWDKAGRPTDAAEIKQIMQDAVQKQAGGKGVLPAWENNTIRALTADDPTKIALSGPKVHSFYHNLMGHTNEVTNDAWMAAFSKIDPIGAGSKMSGALNKSGPGKSPTYLAMSAKVRAAAKMLSNMTGEAWTPAEVQETVWSWAKTAYEHSEELGDHTIPELVKHGKLTDELIRSTPDFHQLFGTPENRGFLSRSRYAEDAERLAGTKGAGAGSSGPSKASTAAEKTLRPSLMKAAERLESLRQERNAAGSEPAPF